jgi:arylsulfatase A-like enzyme
LLGRDTRDVDIPFSFGLSTGVYPWRNKNAKILPGTAPLIISTEQMTVPKMFKTAGYHTGVVGKWLIIFWNAPRPTPYPRMLNPKY